MASAVQKIGSVGYVKDYTVVMLGDTVAVLRGEEEVAREEVTGLGRFIANAGALRVGWAELPDFEVVYLYDRADDAFGYAVNLADSGLSEWGYAPFVVET